MLLAVEQNIVAIEFVDDRLGSDRKIVRAMVKHDGDYFKFADDSLNSPLKKASLTGFHATAKHIAAKAVSPSSETIRTI